MLLSRCWDRSIKFKLRCEEAEARLDGCADSAALVNLKQRVRPESANGRLDLGGGIEVLL